MIANHPPMRSSNEEREPQATKTATETPKAEPKKRERERPTTDTLDDNPLICRGID